MNKNILENCDLLLSILKEPLPTTPVIIDFSYLNKPTISETRPEQTKRKLDAISEYEVYDSMNYNHCKKAKIQEYSTTYNQDLATNATSYCTLDFISYCINSYSGIQPATEFDNFYYTTNHHPENFLFD